MGSVFTIKVRLIDPNHQLERGWKRVELAQFRRRGGRLIDSNPS